MGLLVVVHARVNQIKNAVFFDGAAGKAPELLIVGHVGGEGHADFFKMDEVLRDEMEPMHRSPFDVVGIILGEQVVLSLEIAKAIGVIHPSFGRRNVKLGSKRIHNW